MKIIYDIDALEYIAKVADGGMRDAITLLDKCLAYSTDITMENVIKALGVADYDTMFDLTDMYLESREGDLISIIEDIHMSGKDLKQFIRTYLNFILDVCKFDITRSFTYISIPNTFKDKLGSYDDKDFDVCRHLLNVLIRLNNDIKWDSNPKSMIEATLLAD